jgi:nucleoid-associated protein EbfC
MLKGLGDMGQIMKMQKDLKALQKNIQKSRHEGTNKNSTVTAVVSGEYNLLSISIDEEFMKSGSPKDVEKAVVEACNSAVKTAKSFSEDEMKKITGGLNIPGLGGLMG